MTEKYTLSEKKVHSCVGIYHDGTEVNNAVADSDLESHIQYNLRLRPARALFVDGRCVIKGMLDDKRIAEIELELQSRGTHYDEPILPYR